MTDIVFREMRQGNGVASRYRAIRRSLARGTRLPLSQAALTRPTNIAPSISGPGSHLFAEHGTPLRAARRNGSCVREQRPEARLWPRHHHRTPRPKQRRVFHAIRPSFPRFLGRSCKSGQTIARGQRIGAIGTAPTNGDWAPHLHFQIITDLLNLGGDSAGDKIACPTDFPGVAFASQRDVWLNLSPDPNLLIGIPMDRFPQPEPSKESLLATRRGLLGGNLSVSYDLNR